MSSNIFDAVIDLREGYLDEAVLANITNMKEIIKSKIYILCGYPGSGKGTCGEILARELGVIHISTGDLFRREVSLGTPLGLELQGYMSQGQFVPPALANKILGERLAQQDTQNGVLLDGFPRSIEHLQDLDEILRPTPLVVESAIFLDVPEDLCQKRLCGRRHCSNCQAKYNLYYQQMKEADRCDICLSPLIQRADDAVDVISKRFQLAKESLTPLLEELHRRDLLFTLRVHVSEHDNAACYASPSPSPERVSRKMMEIMCFPSRFHSSNHFTAYQKISIHLNHLLDLESKSPTISEWSSGVIPLLARDIRDCSLAGNSHKRTGVTRRFVYLSTENANKMQEFVRVFDRYGVEVLQLPSLPGNIAHWSPATQLLVRQLLSDKTSLLTPLALLRETSDLLKPFNLTDELLPSAIDVTHTIGDGSSRPLEWSVERSSCRPGVQATHVSVLTALWVSQVSENKGQLCAKMYAHQTRGRIVKRGTGGSTPVFGWDDQFVLLATDRSYHDHKEAGLKISSRDMTISAFLQDRIYYKQLNNLRYSPLELTRPVDFSVDVADFVHRQDHYNSPIAIEFGLKNMLTHVLNEGIFFKGADTRIEANYWQPGLNAGLPLISKKDPIHEKTFMFHDFGHFLMKDLIFTGVDTPVHRCVYIIHRMMSEAVTIMLADGVFVDAMFRSGVEYDFSTRKIYPLVKDVGFDFSDKETFLINLRKLVKASVDYTLKGDDMAFRALLAANGKGDETFIEYESKFKPFFVSDFQWTVHNYENMASRSHEMRAWWDLTAPVRSLLDLPLETIDEFVNGISLGESSGGVNLHGPDSTSADNDVHPLGFLIDLVFDRVFDKYIAPVFTHKGPLELLDPSTRIRRGFLRYMIGQMGLFARFSSVPENSHYLQQLTSLLQSNASIDSVRESYEEYLSKLLHKNLISQDDMHNYREIYPLFEPFYVTYDRDAELYPDLKVLSRELLSFTAHRKYQYVQVEKFLNKPLSKKEKRFYDRMATLIESSGGQIEDGIFVSKPGITLLAISHTESTAPPFELQGDHPDIMHASFLLSGIAVESSMELIAHSEASVARLTSSKTQAMSTPLLRVQGKDAHRCRTYLTMIQHMRTAFEFREKPAQLWESGLELFNMTQSGCKATALVYTMSLTNFHKLFIGRMGEAGNECEVRLIAKTMACLLHEIFPNYILAPEQYLALANGEKYSVGKHLRPFAHVSSAHHRSSVAVVSRTHLTRNAYRVFRSLHIDNKATEAEQLAEFCSRITYLAFSDEPPTTGAATYLQKMIREFQHLSITSAFHIGFGLETHSERDTASLTEIASRCGGVVLRVDSTITSGESGVLVLSFSLKSLHKFLKECGTLSGSGFIQSVASRMVEWTALLSYQFVIDPATSYGLCATDAVLPSPLP